MPEGLDIVDYSGCILSAGFIDTHVHYVQTDMIASPGKQLLAWVSDYIYPAEEAFADEAHARGRGDACSATSCCATARRRRWSSARSIRNRSTRCSRKR